jgi:fatty acid desaturase
MAEYLSPQQEQVVARLLAAPTARTEWPTWLLILAVYGAWLAPLVWSHRLGLAATTLLLILACTWYMSLQHELVHGHPTRWRSVNKLFGLAPLAVWFPYTLYLESHLRHHNDAHLTLPGMDPETHYVSDEVWQRSGWWMRALFVHRKRFWGRFVFGPAMAIASVAQEAVGQLRAGQFRYLRMWSLHIAMLVAMLAAIERWTIVPAWYYLLLVAYPALSLAMVRSYYEHRAADDCKHRIVINEAAWPMRLLYLNNNYHLVHHDLPALPWYLLPRVYRADRDAYLARCGGFRIGGYGELAWRFGSTPVDAPVHPMARDRQA